MQIKENLHHICRLLPAHDFFCVFFINSELYFTLYTHGVASHFRKQFALLHDPEGVPNDRTRFRRRHRVQMHSLRQYEQLQMSTYTVISVMCNVQVPMCSTTFDFTYRDGFREKRVPY